LAVGWFQISAQVFSKIFPRGIVILAGDYIAVGLDAHVVFGCGTPFNPQLQLEGITDVILG
jgi:hypothetical protein